jgi:cell division septal protein FtsQ
MNRRRPARSRTRQKQINILHTTTRQRHSQKQIMQMAGWSGLVLAMIIGVGVALHFGVNFVLDKVLYSNPRYDLAKIDIEPRGHFSPHLIRQVAGLETGQNLWTLDLRQIAHDVETLPNVSDATVERQFPDKITILIRERVPVVKIVGLDIDLDKRETFYLDREGVVLKPRDDEPAPLLPEVIGLSDAELEPGTKLDQPRLQCAMEILDAIDHTELHTSIDISTINLSDPLSITMVTTRHTTIVFRSGVEYIDQQLIRLQQATAYADGLQRTLQSIDLTPDRNVPITFCQNQ